MGGTFVPVLVGWQNRRYHGGMRLLYPQPNDEKVRNEPVESGKPIASGFHRWTPFPDVATLTNGDGKEWK